MEQELSGQRELVRHTRFHRFRPMPSGRLLIEEDETAKAKTDTNDSVQASSVEKEDDNAAASPSAWSSALF